jgi:hypothetical protein
MRIPNLLHHLEQWPGHMAIWRKERGEVQRGRRTEGRFRRKGSELTCSRENINDTNQVVIVDLADANNVIRRPSAWQCIYMRDELMIVTADSAIMHPKEKIIALKGE